MIKKILNKMIDIVFHFLMALTAMFLTFWVVVMIITIFN